MRIHKFVALATLVPLVVALDQGSKAWIRDTIYRTGPVEVIPGFFRLGHVENPGAAWGLLADAEHRIPFFVVSTLLAFVVIGVFFWRLPGRNTTALAVALSSILGGAIGNFIDRLRFHSVTDFLDFYIGVKPVSSWLIRTVGSNRWPSFNVADVAIVAGLVLILYDMVVLEPRRMAQSGAEGNDAREGGAGLELRPASGSEGGAA